MVAIDQPLQNGDIYIGLFSRRQAADFHWAIATPTDLSNHTFVKFDASNSRGVTWSYRCVEENLSLTGGLTCLVKIGELSLIRTTVQHIHD